MLWEGAKPFTQCCDIATTCSLAVEKALDSNARGCLFQCDIQRFYDSIDLFAVIKLLLSWGLEATRLAAILRLQYCVRISLLCLGASTAIGMRTSGALTGSRVAGAMGRVPLLEFALEHSPWLSSTLWHAPGPTMPLMSWVDNIFGFTLSIHDAIAVGALLRSHLKNIWKLDIKQGSQILMLPRGSSETLPAIEGWKLQNTVPCIGYLLDHDGGVGSDYLAVKHACWTALWKNLPKGLSRPLPEWIKAKLVSRIV